MTDWRELSDNDLQAALIAAGEPKNDTGALVRNWRECSGCRFEIYRRFENPQSAVTVVPLTTDDPDGPIALETQPTNQPAEAPSSHVVVTDDPLAATPDQAPG